MRTSTKLGTPLEKLDIGMLSSLSALLNERSVSKAARKIGLSQPAMSSALARLRLVFRDPLLVRSGAEMLLTERGELMRDRVDAIIQDLFLLAQQRRFDPRVSSASFEIGVRDYESLILLPAIISRVRSEAPNIRITTTVLDSTSQDDVSANLRLPNLRIQTARFVPPEWHVKKLLDDDLVVIGRKGHPDLVKPLSLERFLDIDQISLSPGSPGFVTRVDAELAKKSLKRKIVVSLVHFTTLPLAIGRTDLIALYPRRLLKAIEPMANLEVAECPVPAQTFSTSLVWHPRYHRDDGHRWMREIISDAASEIR